MIKKSKIFSVIPQNKLREIPLLIVLMVIGAAFEVVGIGLVIPLMAIVLVTMITLSQI